MKDLNWRKQELPVLPDPRSGSGLTSSSRRGIIINFGGVSPLNNNLSDLWLYDKNGWRKKSYALDTLVSVPRAGMGLVYDEDKDKFLLFGGIGTEGFLGDTWVFDGNKWEQQQIDIAPSPRVGFGLTFDVERKVAILFGGKILSGRYSVYLGDTWLWDGQRWSQQFPEGFPSPRYGSSMAYDAAGQKVFLFGGVNDDGILGDTWVWDGIAWSEIQPPNFPAKRVFPSIAYDEESQYIILYGGQSTSGPLNDTWMWDGKEWIEIDTQDRPPLQTGYAPQLCYDPVKGKIILFSMRQEKKITPSEDVDFKAWSEVWILD